MFDFAAIGWTLTGTMNSPSTNLAWHYPSAASGDSQQQHQQRRQRPQPSSALPGLISMALAPNFAPTAQNVQSQHLSASSSNSQPPPAITSYPTNGSTVINAGTGDLLMGLNSPYQSSNTLTDTPGNTFTLQPTTQNNLNTVHNNDFTSVDPTNDTGQGFSNWNYDSLWGHNASMQPFGDMMIESQDVDMSILGLDMMPWFEPTQDFSRFFGTGGQPSPADPNGAATATGAQRTPQGS